VSLARKENFYVFIDWWLVFALVLNSVFLLDLIAHVYLFGFKRLMARKKE